MAGVRRGLVRYKGNFVAYSRLSFAVQLTRGRCRNRESALPVTVKGERLPSERGRRAAETAGSSRRVFEQPHLQEAAAARIFLRCPEVLIGPGRRPEGGAARWSRAVLPPLVWDLDRHGQLLGLDNRVDGSVHVASGGARDTEG